ncbi:MAG: dihydroxy-acid dehydratase, partial [Pseudomonadota bacterium]|nr:dihydroxy-acid dehydratase [Pseudomonadota bacterium]
GLFMGALAFGHLPVVFAPAGPMPSGIPNAEKARVRAEYAQNKVDRQTLLESEIGSYHSPGTCTFYGTANSNQMLMEVMGLHLPGSAFVNPHDDLRHALTVAATERAIAIARGGSDPRPISRCLDERSFVNAIVGLHATGGSTNHTLHLPAMAAAAGITLTWEDFADLSEVTPLLARVYPNGKADVNHFHAAGGMGFVIRELLKAGLLDGSAMTVTGSGLIDHACEPVLTPEGLSWRDAQAQSLDPDILRPASTPHAANGGLRMLDGNLGKAVVKISAVAADRHVVEAPAAVFTDEASVKAAYNDGALNRDVVVVVRGQGPRANGMPELHSLTPMLANLQDQGFAVALVTDGRMSGASGTVPAAIHVSPEAVAGGAIGRVADGDMIRLDARAGTLSVAAELSGRPDFAVSNGAPQRAFARPLFSAMRAAAGTAEQGAGLSITET